MERKTQFFDQIDVQEFHLWLQKVSQISFIYTYVYSDPRYGCTAIRFVSTSAQFGICTVVHLYGTLFEAKILTWDTRMRVFQPQQWQFKEATRLRIYNYVKTKCGRQRRGTISIRGNICLQRSPEYADETGITAAVHTKYRHLKNSKMTARFAPCKP